MDTNDLREIRAFVMEVHDRAEVLRKKIEEERRLEIETQKERQYSMNQPMGSLFPGLTRGQVEWLRAIMRELR